MSKKMLSLALALAMCLGLTVPAFADSAYDYSVIYSFDGEEDSVYNFNYSANGYTDPSAENVTFSVAPIGMAKIRWVFPGGTSEYAAYVELGMGYQEIKSAVSGHTCLTAYVS